jgi:integrase
MSRGEGQVYRRGGVYWIDYFHRGERHRESTHTDDQKKARKLLRERLVDYSRGKTGAIASGKITFAQMADAFVTDYRIHGKRSLATAKGFIKHLRGFFDDDLAVDIRTPRIRQYIRVKQEEGYSNGTINRQLAALRRMFSLLIEDELLESMPHFPMLPEADPRQGTIEPADFARVVSLLPEYLRLPAEFAYISAWRKGEVRTLEWRDVNLSAREIRLRPANSKNKTARVIPLTGRLLEIMERAHALRRLDCPYVFHRSGRRIGDFRKTWDTARQSAGHSTLRFHDLRRSGVTNMRRAGVEESTAMKVSGHKTVTVFRRYKIEGLKDIERGLERLDSYLDGAGHATKVTPLRSAQ